MSGLEIFLLAVLCANVIMALGVAWPWWDRYYYWINLGAVAVAGGYRALWFGEWGGLIAAAAGTLLGYGVAVLIYHCRGSSQPWLWRR